MHKLTIKLSEKDYLDFLFESNEHGLTAEEQIHQIINYYIINPSTIIFTFYFLAKTNNLFKIMINFNCFYGLYKRPINFTC